MTDLRLNLPKDQRISTLAMSIWKTGITPWSWIYQCPPDFLPDPLENRIAYAVEVFLQKLEFDNALLGEIERAREIAAAQGRELKLASELPADTNQPETAP